MQRIETFGNRKRHSKASEEYVEVKFQYDDEVWEGWIPVEYRRTGTSITDDGLDEYLSEIYAQLNPNNRESWNEEQNRFWREEKAGANVTKPFFDVLAANKWVCVNCKLPTNPNWARRIQDLKEFGYTISTDTKRYCQQCAANKTHLLLVPIPRGGKTGYETWSPALRRRILKLLGNYDIYEAAVRGHLLPDHKFPEIRWDDKVAAENPDTMSDDEIRSKFQLLSNQRNQQKREVCRTCFQSGKRGVAFGIPFYYCGTQKWDPSIPKQGKQAEAGCVGCAWYDFAAWREALNTKLTNDQPPNGTQLS